MTLPIEEANSLIYARLFLRSMLDPKMTPKIPKKVRQEAAARLRHFPSSYIIREYIRNTYGDEIADQVVDQEEIWDSRIGVKEEDYG